MTQADDSRKVLIVEDHAAMAFGFQEIIKTCRGMQVCAVVNNVHDIVETVERYRPHVVLMDLFLPDQDGAPVNYDWINQRGLSEGLKLKNVHPEIGVLFTSALVSGATVRIILDSKHKGLGFIQKGADPDELCFALKQVAKGEKHVDFRTNQALLSPRSTAERYIVEHFSSREREVLKQVASGLSRNQMAEQMHIRPGVVDKYLDSIRSKLRDARVTIGDSPQVYSFVHLTHLAIAINLVSVLPIEVGHPISNEHD